MTEKIQEEGELALDKNGLYREESFTDLHTGSIRRYTPVTVDGRDDPARPPVFVVHTQLMTRMGPIPLEVPVEAATLAEAADKFPAAIEAAMAQMAEAMERRQREEASRIVVPGIGGGGPDLKLR